MRSVIFFIAFLCLLACSGKKADEGIIPKEQMGMILWDIIQADQYSNQYLKKDSARINIRDETMKMYDEIFQIHHITREQFKRSYQYYLEHPQVTKTMMDSLSAQANRRRNEIYRRPVHPLTPAQPARVEAK